jgi:hypothetical protein
VEREKMTEPDGMYGEDIRHALSAVADLVVPAGDGLQKIRKRTRHRSPAFAWLTAYAMYLPRALVNSVRVPGSELILMAKGQSTVFRRLWAGLRKLTPKASSPQAWLRPMLAAGGALVLVVAVMLAVPRLRQTVTNSSMNNTTTSSHTAGSSGGGNEETAGGSQAAIGPGSHKSGVPVSVSPTAGSGDKCAGKGGSGLTSGGNPTGQSSAAAARDVANNRSAEHCPSSSPSPQSSSPGSSTNPSSPSSGSPTSNPTTPPPPTGGGTPTPTSTAVTESPSGGDTGTGGS